MKTKFYSIPILALVTMLATSSVFAQQNCTGYTLTQGAYKNAATNNGAGAQAFNNYLNNNPGSVVSVTIGCGTNTVTLSGVNAISSYLGSNTGTPTTLPTGSTFSSQLVTLSLNVLFDAGDNLSGQTLVAGSFVGGDGKAKSIPSSFAGLTVGQFLDLANLKIGGCPLPSSYSSFSASDFNGVADAINNNYDNGSNNGLVTCCDKVAPEFKNVGANQTIDSPATPQFSTPTAIDAQDGDLTSSIKFSDVKTNGQCAASYSVTRTWTVTDKCGNSATASQTITVQDITPPVFDSSSLPPATVTASCDNVPTPANVTATDAGSGATVTFGGDQITPGSCAGNYTITRTWTATDGCSNVATTSQTITVIDNTPPTLTGAPADVTVSCDNVPAAATVTATDNCSGASVAYDQQTTPGSCTGSYTITRTWTATDGCGNVTKASQKITVVDNTPPTLAGAPADVTASCDNIPAAATVTATDNCSGASVAYNQQITPGSCLGSYTITRTWTATDGCGNAVTASQKITVTDNTAPVLAGVPADASASCDNVPTAANVTATDNCSGATVVLSEKITNGACAGNYTITRTWTATDGCGNAVTASQKITVTDNTAPVLAGVPADASASCDNVPTAATVTATDNCSGATVVLSEKITNGACAGNYTITRTWTATDGCGNATSATQKITVTDTQAPVIAALPAPSTITCGNTPVFAQATATDLCSTVTLTSTTTSVDDCLKGGYTVTKTWTATDACGNASTASQTITVISCEQVTVTQGGWGATANGNNWGTYLSKNFASAFPSGLTVGIVSSGKYVSLASATDVHNFLPNSGTPAALTKAWPSGTATSKTLKNTLAGQAVALTLNIKFWPSIANLVVKSGAFAGTSVRGALDIANRVLSGSTEATPSAINDVLNSININFDGGANLGYLTCPNTSGRDGDQASADEMLRENTNAASDLVTISSYPNPFSDRVKIEFSVVEDSHVNLQLFNSSGVRIQTLFDGVAEKGVQYRTEYISSSPGLYIYRMSTPRGTISGKVIHTTN